MRAVKEVREEMLSRGGRYGVVRGARKDTKDPSPLKVKEVCVNGRRYIVSHNDEQAERDRADGEIIVAALREHLKRSDTPLVGVAFGLLVRLCEAKVARASQNRAENEK